MFDYGIYLAFDERTLVPRPRRCTQLVEVDKAPRNANLPGALELKHTDGRSQFLLIDDDHPSFESDDANRTYKIPSKGGVLTLEWAGASTLPKIADLLNIEMPEGLTDEETQHWLKKNMFRGYF